MKIDRTNLTPRPARRAFTLIELLVVISIIALLAAFTIPVMKVVARKKIIDRTRGEMAQIETAIESYKAARGFYPPSNPKYDPANPATSLNALFNPLFFELQGTTLSAGAYHTLDGAATINSGNLALVLGVGGFINSTKSGVVAGEDAAAAKNFLPDLTANRIGMGITNNADPSNPVTLLIAAVGGPDPNYQPLNANGVNPWRYVSPGIHNPNSYDLWIQLSIGSSFSGVNNFTSANKYLICNWSKQVEHNSPLP